MSGLKDIAQSAIATNQYYAEVTGNNIANSKSTGYCANNVSFLSQQYGGVRSGNALLNTELGGMTDTNRDTDCAISNKANYFVVKEKNGTTLLSRNGNFHFNKQGDLLDIQGRNVCAYQLDKTTHTLKTSYGAINSNDAPPTIDFTPSSTTANPTPIQLTFTKTTRFHNGKLEAEYKDTSASSTVENQWQVFATLALATPPKPEYLQHAEAGAYALNGDVGKVAYRAAQDKEVLGGKLNDSNVKISQSLLNLMGSKQFGSALATMIKTDSRMQDDLLGAF